MNRAMYGQCTGSPGTETGSENMQPARPGWRLAGVPRPPGKRNAPGPRQLWSPQWCSDGLGKGAELMPVGIGLIGAGRIGRKHAETVSRLPAARLVAVADADEAAAAAA